MLQDKTVCYNRQNCSQGQSKIQELSKAGKVYKPSYVGKKKTKTKLEKQKEMQQWDSAPRNVLSRNFCLNQVEFTWKY